MRVRCRMGILWFPFDEQLCVIAFGSWSYTSSYLNYTLMNENPVIENYTEHNEWSLIEYKPFRYEIKFSNWIEDDTFTEIRYKILIRRKPLFVIQNCVFPAMMLCLLTLVSFFIPFAQAMQIGISIMLSFSVFKLRLSDDVPVQSDSIPLINIYFTLCMTFSLTAMVWFSIVNLLKERKKVPDFCKMLVLKYLCYVMCIKLDEKKSQSLDQEKLSMQIKKGAVFLSGNSKDKYQKTTDKKTKMKHKNSENEYGFGYYSKSSNQDIDNENLNFSHIPKVIWLPQKNQIISDKHRMKDNNWEMLISKNTRHHFNMNSFNTSTAQSTPLTNLNDRNTCLDSSRSSSANSKSTQLKNIFDGSILINNEFIPSKAKHHSRSRTLHQTSLILNERNNCRNKNLKEQLSEQQIIKILNNFLLYI
ncbi:neuronal acetylcholine receptor subunit alpha-10-like [Brachionus plicatilis]|uniref:Neuronal acetylcholine receptor subunit alpha-10-like n=1 Tax=Brachionus plicatilis TaxID=10195 RepID=A0A3M7RDL6_BRAPC|nr:neuronal acetylcholine receptor subunit alpha-10-like [Brachionus plicatilis]